MPLAINDMFLHVLSRPATQKEIFDIGSPKMYNFRAGSKTTPSTPTFWTNYYQDVMWALLNSRDFTMLQ